MLQLRELTTLQFLRLKARDTRIISQEAIVVDGTDQKEHLRPSKSRHGFDGSNTVGNISELDARSDFSGEAEHFLDDVTDYNQLANATVLQLGVAVSSERVGIDVVAKAKGIKETSWPVAKIDWSIAYSKQNIK